jgi:hypothetical protein
MNTFTETLSTLHEALKKNLSNIFLSPPNKIADLEEGKRFDKFKSN